MVKRKVETDDASAVGMFKDLMSTLSGTLAERSTTERIPSFFPGGITCIDFAVNPKDGSVSFKISGPDEKQEHPMRADDFGVLGVGPGCEPIYIGEEDFIAGIVFGETSVVRAPNNQAEMAEARQWIAEIACRRQAYSYGKFPAGLATSQKPKGPIADPNIRDRWAACQTAESAGQASFEKKEKAGKDKKTLHYFMWPSADEGKTPRARIPADPPADTWPYSQLSKISHSFGPFIVDKLGSTPKGNDIYIFVYTGVP